MMDIPISLQTCILGIATDCALFLVVTTMRMKKNFFHRQESRYQLRKRRYEKTEGSPTGGEEKRGQDTGEENSGHTGSDSKQAA